MFNRELLSFMRQARLREEGLSYYHCISRVVDRQYIFQEEEKELFFGILP